MIRNKNGSKPQRPFSESQQNVTSAGALEGVMLSAPGTANSLAPKQQQNGHCAPPSPNHIASKHHGVGKTSNTRANAKSKSMSERNTPERRKSKSAADVSEKISPHLQTLANGNDDSESNGSNNNNKDKLGAPAMNKACSILRRLSTISDCNQKDTGVPRQAKSDVVLVHDCCVVCHHHRPKRSHSIADTSSEHHLAISLPSRRCSQTLLGHSPKTYSKRRPRANSFNGTGGKNSFSHTPIEPRSTIRVSIESASRCIDTVKQKFARGNRGRNYPPCRNVSTQTSDSKKKSVAAQTQSCCRCCGEGATETGNLLVSPRRQVANVATKVQDTIDKLVSF